MKTLLLTEVDFAHLQELLVRPELAATLQALPSLKYSLEHDLPGMPNVWDVYEANRDARANSSCPEDFDELSEWLRKAIPALTAWITENVTVPAAEGDAQ